MTKEKIINLIAGMVFLGYVVGGIIASRRVDWVMIPMFSVGGLVTALTIKFAAIGYAEEAEIHGDTDELYESRAEAGMTLDDIEAGSEPGVSLYGADTDGIGMDSIGAPYGTRPF